MPHPGRRAFHQSPCQMPLLAQEGDSGTSAKQQDMLIAIIIVLLWLGALIGCDSYSTE